MASHPPPFQVEDNTDEAFFDELVNDGDIDYHVDHKATPSSASGGHNLDVSKTYDDANSFPNSSLNDDGHKDEVHWERQGSNGEAHWDNSRDDEVNWDHRGNNPELDWEQHGTSDELNWDNHCASDGDNSKANDISSNTDNTEHIDQHGNEFESGIKLLDSLSASGNNGGSGIPEVKEVDWSAFGTASAFNDSNRFGSYSDFLGEFGGTEDVDVLGNMAKKSSDHVHAQGPDDHSTNWQYNGEYYNADAADQSSNFYAYDLNMIKQWESQYPGWKYDVNTGQWYQVDAYDIGTGVHSEANSNTPTGAVADSQGISGYVDDWNQASQGNNATKTTANWNQVLQSSSENNEAQSVWNQASYYNNGYPPHMVFDPQYPGWYYDTIFMEWRPLESYYASIQSNAHDQGQMNQGNLESISASARSTQVQGNLKHGTLESYNVPSRSTAQAQGQMNCSGCDPNQIQSVSYYYERQNPGIQTAQGVGTSQTMDLYSGNIQNPNQYWQNFSVTTPGSQAKSFSVSNSGNQQDSVHYGVKGLYHDSLNQDQNKFSMHSMFDAGGKSIQHFNDSKLNQNGQNDFSNDHYSNQNTAHFSKQQVQTAPISYAPPSGRSSDGRPAHALVTFGFGGKLIVMRHNNSTENLHFGSQNHAHTVSVLNLVEVVDSNIDPSDHGTSASSYFLALGRQSIPGPLTGGSVGTKELNKWIDVRITNLIGYDKAEHLSLLLSLLKIACQFYGKFRSPYGTDVELKESDSPDLSVAKLFASVKRNNSSQLSQYGASTRCLQHIPIESQLQVTAADVQNLLVSGRKREALQCAQEGQFWGLALVLAAQLSDQFYAETVKKMALNHLAAGSPLRTLCLLIANQPADVFSVDNTSVSVMSAGGNMSQQQARFGANGMLDDWEENLAVIVANRTKDDELVLIHLGDCLWKERSDIIAAHICYLVAEASFEPYSDSARLCLVGADHLKFPRTYASPEAIQRTEIYEYSKTLGNSQFVLLPFQPYKFVYALMLAEVGKMSEAMKYCQAVLKSLKNGRTPEVEALRHLASSLEDRIKAHQQGGFYTNLAPKEFIGKLLKVFDNTAHRVVGGLPPSVPTAGGTFHGTKDQSMVPRVSSSQSTMAMSSLMPSQSMEPISELALNSNRKVRHARSVSEPDLGSNPRKGQADSFEKEDSTDEQDKSSSSAASSFGGLGFGTKLFQKTLGFVLKNRRQAKLGQSNKFYYDEKLKRWVEEGAEPPAEEAALQPPPTTTGVFQNGASDYNLKSALQNEAPLSKGNQESKPPSALDSNPGMPPLPPTTNQYSARGRMGVRSRYVDTFNKGGGNAKVASQSTPIIPSAKPVTGANPRFFVPTPAAATMDNSFEAPPANTSWENSDNASTSPQHDSFKSSSAQIQRYPSMNSLERKGEGGPFQAHARRTVSWGGSIDQSFSPPPVNTPEVKPLGEVLGLQASSDQSAECLSIKDGSGDDLHEVEL